MAVTKTTGKTETFVVAPEQQDSKSSDVFDPPVAVKGLAEEKPIAAVGVTTEHPAQSSFLSGSIRLVGQLIRPLMAMYG